MILLPAVHYGTIPLPIVDIHIQSNSESKTAQIYLVIAWIKPLCTEKRSGKNQVNNDCPALYMPHCHV